ncbi:DinB family protein [Ferviditalea candida]|uniref:DinB family protein n=1 Tax=Ferviditalea candida TaxID=3108399 RepID=A0ABU5ZG87_9BACL|nr:DinB family protein [Paenibacillaceae bacterium T2]
MSRTTAYMEQINEQIDITLQKARQLNEATIRWKPADNVWSIMEILCHVEEIIPYWLNELSNVVKSPGASWGRGLDHPARLEAVAAADSRSVAEVLQGIEASKQIVNSAFSSMSDADLDIESPHRNPKFGVKPMTFLIDHFLVQHLTNHNQQIDRDIQLYKDRG